jgi:hypothetical protein
LYLKHIASSDSYDVDHRMVGCHVEDIPHVGNLGHWNGSFRMSPDEVSSDLLPYVSAAAMNPQRLPLINYMTPMAALLNGGPTR